MPFSAWLFRIASNAMADQFKRANRERCGTDDTPDPPVQADISSTEMELVERHALLFRLVEKLPKIQRCVICKRFFEERSIKQIAQLLGKTEGAVKQLQFRALERLCADKWGAAMPKRSAAEQLDLAINDLLAHAETSLAAPASRMVAKLLPLIRPLQNRPRPEFKARLRTDLQRTISMNRTASSARAVKPAHFRRENFPNIAPAFFVNNAPKFIDFLVAAFNGAERIRVPRPNGSIMYAEVGIGNSVIELADANQEYPPRCMATHLYVPDADATYANALAAGATRGYAPTDDHPSGDRWGEAKDAFGNTWYIATRKGQVPGPEDFLTVQPYLHLSDAHKMIPFIEAAFGAHATGLHKSPDGKVLHATIEIYGATFEIDEAQGDIQPTPSYLHVYVPDTDALYAQAVAAGAKGIKPPYTAPYADRAATITDPFGNTWFLATYIGEEH